jgi:AcrR family transcriptional regulator
MSGQQSCSVRTSIRVAAPLPQLRVTGQPLKARRRSTARRRDAARSREAILAAAEELFSERGFEAASLHEIGAAAGLSRGAPGYFYGSKDALYREVLARVYAAREAALSLAFAPLVEWASEMPPAEGRRRGLREALDGALAEYWRFLDGRPSFARLVAREALAGAERLADSGGQSGAAADALRAVHATRMKRGLGDFDPVLVSVAFVSLAFLPVAHGATFARRSGLDTGTTQFRERYRRLVVDAILHLVGSRE